MGYLVDGMYPLIIRRRNCGIWVIPNAKGLKGLGGNPNMIDINGMRVVNLFLRMTWVSMVESQRQEDRCRFM